MKEWIESYMVKSPYVGETEMKVSDALNLLREYEIRHLPIVEEGELVGVVSDRDLREAVALPQADTLSIDDIMKREVYVARKSTPLRDVIGEMLDRKVGSAVVVNDEREVLGIFTTTDALRILAEMLEDENGEEILLEDQYESWVDRSFDLDN